MHGRRLFLSILILFGLLIVTLVIRTINASNSSLPAVHDFPDGSRVSIVKVFYGKELSFPSGKYWQKLAGQILPRKIAQRLGIKINTVSNATDTTFIVIENTRTNGAFSGFPAMAFNFGTTLWMKDDDGNEFRLRFLAQLAKGSNDVLEVFGTPLVSHVATNMNIRLFRSDWLPHATNYYAEFSVPNPAPHAPARWKANHLPLTNVADGLMVVFSAVEPTSFSQSSIAGQTVASPDSTATLHFSEDGIEATNWEYHGFTVQDEEGNVSGSDAHLSPREPRKFRFEMVHTLPSRPDDFVTFHDVPVANASNTDFVPVATNFGPYQISITRFPRGQINYKIKPGLANLRGWLSISYVDDEGQKHLAVKHHALFPSGAGVGFGPAIPKYVQKADVTFRFAPTTNRYVEFIGLPEPAKTNR